MKKSKSTLDEYIASIPPAPLLTLEAVDAMVDDIISSMEKRIFTAPTLREMIDCLPNEQKKFCLEALEIDEKI